MRELAFAKVNIFLKIVGTRDNYHEIASRFMRVDSLYDEVSFVESKEPLEHFTLEGDFSCELEKNTIYKAYKLLLDQNHNNSAGEFFKYHKVVVEKNIPEFAGLGGGSSDCASFLRLANRVLDLDIALSDLALLGAKIGADVPFFIYNFKSANISGIGEVVEEFSEELLDIQTYTPPVRCNTKDVYKRFREAYLDKIDKPFSDKLLTMKSIDILENFDAKELNDLLPPSLDLYPKLGNYVEKNSFFSGSGSTFFKVDNGKKEEL